MATTDIYKKVKLFAIDRYKLLKDIDFNNTVVSDRSYICSLVYQSLELERNHNYIPFESIGYIYNEQLAIIKPTLVVYLHCEPDIIYERLQNRSNDDMLSIEEIIRLQARYHLVFKLFNLNVLTINTNHSISNTVSKVLSHVT